MQECITKKTIKLNNFNLGEKNMTLIQETKPLPSGDSIITIGKTDYLFKEWEDRNEIKCEVIKLKEVDKGVLEKICHVGWFKNKSSAISHFIDLECDEVDNA